MVESAYTADLKSAALSIRVQVPSVAPRSVDCFPLTKRNRRLTVGQTTLILGIGVAVAQQTLTLLVGVQLSHPQPYGELTEWIIVAVLKTVDVTGIRRFKSYTHRHILR